MYCEICNADNLRDFPLCPNCETLRHYTNSECRCPSCSDPNYFPHAVRARFPGLVLVAKSDDPPGVRRFVFSLDAIKPERRQAIACGLAELITDAA